MLSTKELTGKIKPYFSNADRLYHFIYHSRLIHGNKYDYSKAVYTKAREKITIVCPTHGPFQMRADNHKQGKGCPKCKSRAHDVFYFWRLGNTNIYKYGITTSSRKHSRINEVAKSHDVKPHILRYYKLKEAYTLERLVKTTYSFLRAEITGDGRTEMLELNAAQLREVLQFIDTRYKLLLTDSQ